MSVSIYSNTKIDIIAAKIGNIYPISNQNKVANLKLFLDPDSTENIVTHEDDDYDDDHFWYRNFMEISEKLGLELQLNKQESAHLIMQSNLHLEIKRISVHVIGRSKDLQVVTLR